MANRPLEALNCREVRPHLHQDLEQEGRGGGGGGGS